MRYSIMQGRWIAAGFIESFVSNVCDQIFGPDFKSSKINGYPRKEFVGWAIQNASFDCGCFEALAKYITYKNNAADDFDTQTFAINCQFKNKRKYCRYETRLGVCGEYESGGAWRQLPKYPELTIR